MARLICVEDLVGPSVLGRGGHAMHVLQILESLRRLGHDVLFLEYLDEPPSPAALATFERARRALVGPRARRRCCDAHSGACLAGVTGRDVRAFAARADGLLSLAAHYRAEPWPLLEDVRPRLLLEQDPGYTHLWAADGDPADDLRAPRRPLHRRRERRHRPQPRADLRPATGIRCGRRSCSTGGRAATIRRAIASRPSGSWRDYGYLDFEGRAAGPEGRGVRALPRAAGALRRAARAGARDRARTTPIASGCCRIRLAAGGSSSCLDARIATATTSARSAGEFSCAKGGYVGTRSGWFSDRSACYLAAGRPVVLQATGFEDVLPTGAGLFAVHTAEEAAAALAEIRARLRRATAPPRASSHASTSTASACSATRSSSRASRAGARDDRRGRRPRRVIFNADDFGVVGGREPRHRANATPAAC